MVHVALTIGQFLQDLFLALYGLAMTRYLEIGPKAGFDALDHGSLQLNAVRNILFFVKSKTKP